MAHARKERATAMFEIVSWDEVSVDEPVDAPRITHVTVRKTFTGDLEGDGVVRYVMMHRRDGTASFVGQERITGRLGDRTGSFVLEHRGIYEGGMSRTSWTVVPGSGTEELRGIQGKGGFASGHAKHYPMTLEYDVI